jgi:hypothetical protein
MIELIGRGVLLLAAGASARVAVQQLRRFVESLSEMRRKERATVVSIARVDSDTQRALVVRVEAPAHSRETTESLDRRAARIYAKIESEDPHNAP